MRIGVVWDTRTQWLGGWNYFLNMARVTRAFAPNLKFVLLSSSDLSEARRKETLDAGIELALSIQPFKQFMHPMVLLGARHKDLNTALKVARIDLVFELTNYLGRLDIPALSWIPDAQHRALPQMFSRRERLQRDLEFYRRLTHHRHVILSSASAERDIRTFMPNPPAQLHVVPFAVRPVLAMSDAAIEETQTRYRLQPGYIYLPNQFWQHKNHLTALRAMSLLVSRGVDIRLVLSGQLLDTRDGRHALQLSQAMNDPALGSRVSMLGVIPYENLLALMAGSRALLNPSLFEGWSTTVEEAKALGTQMVLSDLAVHREQADRHAAVFFNACSVEACAEALEQASGFPMYPDEKQREMAREANLRAQEIYAEKFAVACRAAVGS